MKFFSLATAFVLASWMPFQESLAFTLQTKLSSSSSCSSKSIFLGDAIQNCSPRSRNHRCRSGIMTMYEPAFDPSDKASSRKKLKAGFWVALDHTEKWISDTLSSSTRENPHARKEVTYDCELNQQVLATIAGIFRRYKEARQLAQKQEYHEKQKEQEYKTSSANDSSKVFKRTQVMIMPFCEYFDEFESFESVMQAIHQARKNALDLITDLSIEKLERRNKSIKTEQEWSISVNGASLHPDYQTPKEILDQMQLQGLLDDEENRQILERKNRARKSPYPTLVIEVKAEPQPDDVNGRIENKQVELVGALDDVVKRLESIYAMSAAMHKRGKDSNEDIFFNAIGLVPGIQELSPVNAIEFTQGWIQENDTDFNKHLSTFTSSDLQHVDSAYEFVFLNLSLQKYLPFQSSTMTLKPGARSYLILPKFISNSATSFDKFTDDVRSIIATIHGLDRRVSISAMHPEHIDATKRSPHPVIVLQWFDEVE